MKAPDWRHDLPAGLLVGGLLLPQALAYAMLAGLPPVAGVMASLLPLGVYALLGSSRQLAMGPVAILALMVASATPALAATHGADPWALALLLSLEAGTLLALAAALRLDALAALLSAPVLHGFVSGAALAIALGQIPKLIGLNLPGSTLLDWGRFFASGPELRPDAWSAAFGLGAVALLVLARRRRWRLAPLGVVALAIAAVAALQAGGHHLGELRLTGAVHLLDGLRFPSPFALPAALWLQALPAAALIALVAYVESLAIAQALAARRQERISTRRELVGLAGANLAAGLSGGLPVAGSFSRSGLLFEGGARTRWAGALSALLFLVLVSLAAPWLARLPHAVLAAGIVVAVLPLVDLPAFRRAWRYARAEGAVMTAVALLALLLGVEAALAAGVAASIVLLLQRTARPHWAEVGRLPGTEVFRNTKRFQVELLPELLSIRIDEGLLFTNARWLSEVLGAELARRPQARHLLLMMSGVNDIDLSGLEALQQFAQELRVQGVQLHLSELKGPVADRLMAAGLADWLPGRVFRTQIEAWTALSREAGDPLWVSP